MNKMLYLLGFLCFATSAFAQELPAIQSSPMAAPTGIRIDGKAIEWKDTYSAENKRTGIFYNLANDDKNLYLILKSSSSASANKIMLGGINFVVNTEGKKKEKDAAIITYPLIVRANSNRGGARNGGQNRQNGGGGFQNRNQQTAQQRDSILQVTRKTQLATAKEIKVFGFKGITDTLISIYNEYGIKAVAAFDVKGDFIYELAIPLELLNLNTATKEFAYQIKINGLENFDTGGRVPAAGGFGGGNGGANNGGNRGNGGFAGGGNTNTQELMSPTDFWGKYSLLKK